MFKRWRFVLALLVCFVLLLLSTHHHYSSQTCSRNPSAEVSYKTLLHQHEERYLQLSTNLTKLISRLKKDLRERSRQIQRSPLIFSLDPEEKPQSDLERFLQNQLRSAEMSSGERVSDEFSVVPFESFTLHRVYQLETGLSRHPVERPIRPDRRNELDGVLETALHLLNDHQPGDSGKRRSYSPKDFFEGQIIVDYVKEMK